MKYPGYWKFLNWRIAMVQNSDLRRFTNYSRLDRKKQSSNPLKLLVSEQKTRGWSLAMIYMQTQGTVQVKVTLKVQNAWSKGHKPEFLNQLHCSDSSARSGSWLCWPTTGSYSVSMDIFPSYQEIIWYARKYLILNPKADSVKLYVTATL